MNIVTVNKDRYTVDPLYQWDLNRVLEIRGLSLPSIPEIHFTNDTMNKAIVRQSTMDDAGVIRVDVPNSILQKACPIRTYVCIYDGTTFKSLYLITIPVKARNKPGDYTLEDDPEVYSFNALENLINNVLSKYDEVDAKHKDAVNKLNTSVTNYNNARQDLAEANAIYNEDILPRLPEFDTVFEEMGELREIFDTKFNTEDWTFTLADGSMVKKTICVTKSEIVPTSTFTVKENTSSQFETYRFEDGMTWGDWINSPYNTDGYYYNESSVVHREHEFVAYNSKPIMADDLIVANRQYYLDY